eukprot:TRINITY_DN5780_c0_g2_i10.p1 TRINITY_DN5780_c0_g2~~TRINITY_DN5780_c0_g2_i10.p1  ORF type:complete len:181 (-),score=41.69 TRINITY_DN5780_c0_g2_i10:1196-1738(-)
MKQEHSSTSSDVTLSNTDEVPIVIQDYTRINNWEKLTACLDTKLGELLDCCNSQSNLSTFSNSSESGDALSEKVEDKQVSSKFEYRGVNMELVYALQLSIAEESCSESWKEYVKFYNKEHYELLVSNAFPLVYEEDSVSHMIALYFGITEFLYVELKSEEAGLDINYVLSALQIMADSKQ